jgi:hypothetical protein
VVADSELELNLEWMPSIGNLLGGFVVDHVHKATTTNAWGAKVAILLGFEPISEAMIAATSAYTSFRRTSTMAVTS